MNKSVKRILLIEDDPFDADLTIKTFEKNNFATSIDWVKDGEEALDYLYYKNTYKERDTSEPVIILIDLKMPKLGGIEVIKRIKSDHGLKTIPVIVLTSSKEHSDLKEAYKLGVNAYVVKPVKFDQFSKAVKEIGFFWIVHNEQPPAEE